MPQIETPLLLDVLLGLVILLFVPFGIRRGVAKEAIVSAGILFGALLAERFTLDLGGELTIRLGFQPDLAEFVASVAILFSSTFLLGYGGGAALGTVRPGILSRLTGGVLAALNAALLLSFVLAWIDTQLGERVALDNGILSRALLRDTDRLFLGAAGVLLTLTIVGLIVNAARARRQPRDPLGSPINGIPPRQRPVRVAAAPDVGKYEPELELAPPSGRFVPSLDATSPIGPSSARSWHADTEPPPGTNGNHRGSSADTIWRRPSASSSAPRDEGAWAPWAAAEDATVRTGSESPSRIAGAPSSAASEEQCAVCQARVGARDVFCPECGATL